MALIKADITILIIMVQFWIFYYTIPIVESYSRQQYNRNTRSYRRSSHNNNRYSHKRHSSYNRPEKSRQNSNFAPNSKFLGDQSPNSKFLGIDKIINNRNDEERFFHNFFNHGNNKHRPSQHHKPSYVSSNDDDHDDPCDRSNQKGRFWDINVYNVYPNHHQSNGIKCGDYQSNYESENNDHYNDHPRPIWQAWNLIYNLIRPGGALNPQRPTGGGGSGSGSVYRPSSGANNGGDNGDVYDPVYDDKPVNEYSTNDFPTPRPFTPGEIVGSIANTVNGVIQTIAGNRLVNRRRPISRYRRMVKQ